MATVADLLVVEVQVNTGNSAQAVNNLSAGLQTASRAGDQATQTTNTLSRAQAAQGITTAQLTTALFGVSTGLALINQIGNGVRDAISAAAGAAIEFSATMAEVHAVSGASAEQMDRLREAARASGVGIGIGANEGAKGLAELIRGGVSVEAALGGALRASELMAKAGGVDLAKAAEISAVALNSFGLSANQLGHVADLVAGAANASSIGVEDFRQSLSQAGAVARTVGVSFDDTSVAIAELGQAGIKGSDAGTSLRTFLLRLTPESKEAETAMRSLGIITSDGSNRFFDASGKAKGLADVSQILQQSLAGYTDQQKIATLQTIFGTDAVRAASVLAREGAAGFDRLYAAMRNVSAADVARERLNSLSGDLEKLKATIESVVVTADRSPVARGLVQNLTAGVENLGRSAETARRGELAQPLAEAEVEAELRQQFQNAPGFALTRLFEGGDVDAFIAKSRTAISTMAALRVSERGADAFLGPTTPGQSTDVSLREEMDANRRSFEASGTAASDAAEQTNKLIKPARDLRAELDQMARSSKDAATGIHTLEEATAGLRLAGEGDLEAVAALRAEAALRLREQASGARAESAVFRQKIVVETTDEGASADDRARASDRLRFFDQQYVAQLRLAQIQQQRASADRAVQREQDLQRLAGIQFEESQLPTQEQALQLKIASLQLDQQAAPIRSQILAIEQQIATVSNQRLILEREREVLLERQRSAPARQGLEDTQTRIRELQLELQTRDPSLDRGAIRRELRGLQRGLPGQELEVLRSDQTLTSIARQQESTKLQDDLHVNALNQQKAVLEGQLGPLEQRKRLVDDAASTVQRQLELERAQFDQGQLGSRQRLLRTQQIVAGLGLSADEQQAVIAALSQPQTPEGPPVPPGNPAAAHPISVTIQNMGDTFVRSQEDIDAIQQAQQQAVLDAIATALEREATDATPPASTELNGARRPMGQPPNSGHPQ